MQLPYPPSSNRYWRKFRNKIVKSDEARNYQQEIGWLARCAGVECIEDDVAVSLHIYRPIRKGDLDNRIKVVLDALQGIAYENDNQVRELHAFLYDDKDDPRIEVGVWRVVEAVG